MHFDALFRQFFTLRVQAKREDPGIHQSPATMDCRIKSGDECVREDVLSERCKSVLGLVATP